MIKIEINNLGEERDWRDEMVVYHKSESKVSHDPFKEVMRHTDGGEPEDNLFLRDWSWVAGALQDMYDLGKADGALLTAQEISNMIKVGG